MDGLEQLIGTDWWGWILVIALFFGLEFKALFNKERGDTWSEVLRYVFAFSKRSDAQGWRKWIRRGSFFGLAIWFTAHIGFGI